MLAVTVNGSLRVPLRVMVKVYGLLKPTGSAAMLGGPVTSWVRSWVASGSLPLLAVTVIGKTPSLVCVGQAAVPSCWSTNGTPGGGAPVLDREVAVG